MDDYTFEQDNLNNTNNKSYDNTHIIGTRYYKYEDDPSYGQKSSTTGNVIYAEGKDYIEHLNSMVGTQLSFSFLVMAFIFNPMSGINANEVIKVKESDRVKTYTFNMGLNDFKKSILFEIEDTTEYLAFNMNFKIIVEEKQIVEFEFNYDVTTIEEGIKEGSIMQSTFKVYKDNPTTAVDYSKYVEDEEQLADHMLPWIFF